MVDVKNANVAGLLRRYAAVLRLQRADRFKTKAYERAAQTIELLEMPLNEFLESGGALEALPAIGKGISGVIREIMETGTFRALDEALTQLSPELVELASRPSLDPRATLRVYKKLGIHSLDELKESLESGELEQALGARVAYQIRVGLDQRPRMLLWKAEQIAETLQDVLEGLPGVSRVTAIGSLRRKKDTIGDLGFLVAASKPAPVIEKFSKFGGVLDVERIPENTWVFKLSSGLLINLAITTAKLWGVSEILATGSFTHVEELKSLAAKRRMSFTLKSLKATGVDLTDERAIYGALHLSYIEPELREGKGELEAAATNRLPKLISAVDIKGDLHMHTTASDGANSIEEMVEAAKSKGYSFIGITDHSQSLKIAGGQSEKQLREQLKKIDRINARADGIVVLKSAEVDILHDGSLDFADSLLKELDYTICSIHSRFRLNKEQQTTRIMRAMDNRYFSILGHATGRLLLKREGYEVDFPRLIEHAKDVGCTFEINSSPDRLDLSDEHARAVHDAGIKIAINTDAHSTRELDFMPAGLNQARRGWLEAKDVLNALPVGAIKRQFRR